MSTPTRNLQDELGSIFDRQNKLKAVAETNRLSAVETARKNKLKQFDNAAYDTITGFDDADTPITKDHGTIRESTAEGYRYDAAEVDHSRNESASKSDYAEQMQLEATAKYLGKDVGSVTKQNIDDYGNMQTIQKAADYSRKPGEDRWVAPFIHNSVRPDLSHGFDIKVKVNETGKDVYGRSLANLFNANTKEDVTLQHALDPKMNAFADVPKGRDYDKLAREYEERANARQPWWINTTKGAAGSVLGFGAQAVDAAVDAGGFLQKAGMMAGGKSYKEVSKEWAEKVNKDDTEDRYDIYGNFKGIDKWKDKTAYGYSDKNIKDARVEFDSITNNAEMSGIEKTLRLAKLGITVGPEVLATSIGDMAAAASIVGTGMLIANEYNRQLEEKMKINNGHMEGKDYLSSAVFSTIYGTLNRLTGGQVGMQEFKAMTRQLASRVDKNEWGKIAGTIIAQAGVKGLGEGVEEVLQGASQAAGTKLFTQEQEKLFTKDQALDMLFEGVLGFGGGVTASAGKSPFSVYKAYVSEDAVFAAADTYDTFTAEINKKKAAGIDTTEDEVVARKMYQDDTLRTSGILNGKAPVTKDAIAAVAAMVNVLGAENLDIDEDTKKVVSQTLFTNAANSALNMAVVRGAFVSTEGKMPTATEADVVKATADAKKDIVDTANNLVKLYGVTDEAAANILKGEVVRKIGERLNDKNSFGARRSTEAEMLRVMNAISKTELNDIKEVQDAIVDTYLGKLRDVFSDIQEKYGKDFSKTPFSDDEYKTIKGLSAVIKSFGSEDNENPNKADVTFDRIAEFIDVREASLGSEQDNTAEGYDPFKPLTKTVDQVSREYKEIGFILGNNEYLGLDTHEENLGKIAATDMISALAEDNDTDINKFVNFAVSRNPDNKLSAISNDFVDGSVVPRIRSSAEIGALVNVLLNETMDMLNVVNTTLGSGKELRTSTRESLAQAQESLLKSVTKYKELSKLTGTDLLHAITTENDVDTKNFIDKQVEAMNNSEETKAAFERLPAGSEVSWLRNGEKMTGILRDTISKKGHYSIDKTYFDKKDGKVKTIEITEPFDAVKAIDGFDNDITKNNMSPEVEAKLNDLLAQGNMVNYNYVVDGSPRVGYGKLTGKSMKPGMLQVEISGKNGVFTKNIAISDITTSTSTTSKKASTGEEFSGAETNVDFGTDNDTNIDFGGVEPIANLPEDVIVDNGSTTETIVDGNNVDDGPVYNEYGEIVGGNTITEDAFNDGLNEGPTEDDMSFIPSDDDEELSIDGLFTNFDEDTDTAVATVEKIVNKSTKSTVKGRLDTLESNVANAEATIEELQKDAKNIVQTAVQINGTIESNLKTIEKLSSDKKAVQNELDKLKAKTKEVHDKNIAAIGKANGVIKELDRVKAGEKSAARTFSIVKEVLKRSADSIIATYNAYKGVMAAAKNRLAKFVGHIKGLEKTAKKLDKDIKVKKEEVANVQAANAQANRLETKVRNIRDDIDAMVREINAIKDPTRGLVEDLVGGIFKYTGGRDGRAIAAIIAEATNWNDNDPISDETIDRLMKIMPESIKEFGAAGKKQVRKALTQFKKFTNKRGAFNFSDQISLQKPVDYDISSNPLMTEVEGNVLNNILNPYWDQMLTAYAALMANSAKFDLELKEEGKFTADEVAKLTAFKKKTGWYKGKFTEAQLKKAGTISAEEVIALINKREDAMKAVRNAMNVASVMVVNDMINVRRKNDDQLDDIVTGAFGHVINVNDQAAVAKIKNELIAGEYVPVSMFRESAGRSFMEQLSVSFDKDLTIQLTSDMLLALGEIVMDNATRIGKDTHSVQNKATSYATTDLDKALVGLDADGNPSIERSGTTFKGSTSVAKIYVFPKGNDYYVNSMSSLGRVLEYAMEKTDGAVSLKPVTVALDDKTRNSHVDKGAKAVEYGNKQGSVKQVFSELFKKEYKAINDKAKLDIAAAIIPEGTIREDAVKKLLADEGVTESELADTDLNSMDEIASLLTAKRYITTILGDYTELMSNTAAYGFNSGVVKSFDKTRAKYRADKLDLERMLSIYELVGDKGFYVGWDYTVSNRSMIDNSWLNQQNSKIGSRFAVHADSSDIAIEFKAGEPIEQYQAIHMMLAIGQSFDMDPDKNEDIDVFRKVSREVINVDTKLGTATVSDFNPGFKAFIENNDSISLTSFREFLNSEANKDANGKSIHATAETFMHMYQAVDLVHQMAHAKPGDTISTDLRFEVDGITNGMATTLLQMGLSEYTIMMLRKAGIYIGDDFETMNHGKFKNNNGVPGSEGGIDIYESPKDAVKDRLGDALNDEDRVNSLVALIGGDSKWRSFLKPLVMVYIYGASIANIRKHAAYNLVMSGLNSESALKHLETLMGIAIDVDYVKYDSKTDKLVAAKKGEAGAYMSLTPSKIAELSDKLNDIVGGPLHGAFMETFSEVDEYRVTLKMVEEVNYLAFKKNFSDAVESKMKAKDIALSELTKNQFLEIIAELISTGKHYAARNSIGGLQELYKDDSTNPTEFLQILTQAGNAFTNSNAYPDGGAFTSMINKVVKVIASNVGAVGTTSAHSVDGSAMILGHNTAAINIFDALVLGINAEINIGQIKDLNKAYWEINRDHSIMGEAIQRLLRTTNGDVAGLFSRLTTDELVSLYEDVNRITGSNGTTAETLVKSLQKFDVQREALQHAMVNVLQYYGFDTNNEGSSAGHIVKPTPGEVIERITDTPYKVFGHNVVEGGIESEVKIVTDMLKSMLAAADKGKESLDGIKALNSIMSVVKKVIRDNIPSRDGIANNSIIEASVFKILDDLQKNPEYKIEDC